ncbi:MAG TPA: DUF1929 domain-containing protein [Nitrosomonas sp.]|nr:DUF1929 domain-containing protein [Nitrosomonas sp.]HRB31623.1 DUF1929 domain-containing protein [Nitrosomonas sp.]HRB44537.1 DUF1929 domain-containing protein [Nitrosomonas sp.]HRB76618.1 DUF1929 domain-containing protein [Nitrosomonas sp.]
MNKNPFRFFCMKNYFNKALVVAVILLSSPVSATNSTAHIQGVFGALHDWPIIPIAMMSMPDGRVFAYGTNLTGLQGAKMYYTIWDPSLGTGNNAFTVLPNTTNTDIFCAGQSIIPATGQALIVGGDALVNGQRNYANSDVNIFDPETDTLIRQSQQMAYKRWYATTVALPNGEHAILGGRNDKFFAGNNTFPGTVASYSPIPELRKADGSWHSLTTATSDYAYGALGASSWYYPRAWVNPQGDIFILGHYDAAFKLNLSGTGTITKYQTTKPKGGRWELPSVMFSPGKILSLRRDKVAVVVDINSTRDPTVTSAGTVSMERLFGNATVLADGKVWVNGGSSSGNTLTGATLTTELWDPTTNTWTATANAAAVRLYHSASLLLNDGSVMTGGGGAPGPIKQLNGEIYYPPYLFKKDGSGELAPRPAILDAPNNTISWNQEFAIEANETIHRVTLLRLGAVTHNLDVEVRFFDLSFEQPNNIVTAKSPATANIAPPGYYQLFIWNSSGVPSIAKVIHIN